MVSAVGPDARDINAALGLSSTHAPDMNGVRVDEAGRTAQYIAMHDQHGGLILACADMALVEQLDTSHIRSEFERVNSDFHSVKWVAVDANLDSTPLIAAVSGAANIGAKVLLEPTAVVKAQGVLDLLLRGDLAGAFTSSSTSRKAGKIDVMTPNNIELAALFDYARTKGLFEGSEWWSMIDSFGTTQSFRDAVGRLHLSSGNKELEAEIVGKGIVQQAVHLLPFIPHLFVKLGHLGVVSVQLLDTESLTNIPVNPRNVSAQLIVANNLLIWHGANGRSIVVSYHPPHTVSKSDIVSVTGAGDSFAGVLLSEFVDSKNENVLADVTEIKRIVERAQMASVMTLKSRFAVSPEIRTL